MITIRYHTPFGTELRARFDEISRRFGELSGADEDFSVIPSTASLLRAARILQVLSAGSIAHDYAFGIDGSIGIYAGDGLNKHYVDLLKNGTVRYFEENGHEHFECIAAGSAARELLRRIMLKLQPRSYATIIIPPGSTPVTLRVNYAPEMITSYNAGSLTESTLVQAN